MPTAPIDSEGSQNRPISATCAPEKMGIRGKLTIKQVPLYLCMWPYVDWTPQLSFLMFEIKLIKAYTPAIDVSMTGDNRCKVLGMSTNVWSSRTSLPLEVSHSWVPPPKDALGSKEKRYMYLHTLRSMCVYRTAPYIGIMYRYNVKRAVRVCLASKRYSLKLGFGF